MEISSFFPSLLSLSFFVVLQVSYKYILLYSINLVVVLFRSHEAEKKNIEAAVSNSLGVTFAAVTRLSFTVDSVSLQRVA